MPCCEEAEICHWEGELEIILGARFSFSRMQGKEKQGKVGQ